MLQKISIRNYAIIKDLQVSFEEGLNCITGETGAGKSILVGALGLVLGNRAETSALHNSQEKCIIEASFSSNHPAIHVFLHDNELDVLPELLVRREISPAGKSRCFINDTPVTLQQIKTLGTYLADLHQQFDTLDITESNFQLEVIDAFTQQQNLLSEYQQQFNHWSQLNQQIQHLKNQQIQFQKDKDYYGYLYQELADASFKPNEIEQIEQELDWLEHANSIKQQLTAIEYQLTSSDNPVTAILKQAAQSLQPFKHQKEDINQLHVRLHNMYVELQDIASDAIRQADHIHIDDESLQELHSRFALGQKLLKKHQLNSTNELLDLQQSLEEKLQFALHMDDELKQLETTLQKTESTCEKLAQQLHANRQKSALLFSEQVTALLIKMGMVNATLQVQVGLANQLLPSGKSTVQFLWNANKSKQFELLSKSASGGEMSRIMLAIKSLVGKKMSLPTIIFDEIDTGISGESAKQVALIMQELAQSIQIISITHQPQIAAKSAHQYLVYKSDVNGSIQTQVRKLSVEERVQTIAGMIAGENLTSSIIDSVKQMMLH